MKELSQGIKYGARLVFRGQPDYPKQLGQISDAPSLIWACGDLNLTKRPVTALVGARNASALGCRMARRLSHELGQAGDCIVSGLARGIDAAAHQAALETGTIAILAGGLKSIYPPPNIMPLPPSSPKRGSCFKNSLLICARKRITFPFETV